MGRKVVQGVMAGTVSKLYGTVVFTFDRDYEFESQWVHSVFYFSFLWCFLPTVALKILAHLEN